MDATRIFSKSFKTPLHCILCAVVLTTATRASANECASWQSKHPNWLFCDDFESGDLSAWIDVTDIALNTNAENAHNGSHSAQLNYSQGSNGAGWMWKKQLRADSASSDTQYVRWWQKWEAGFEWNNGPSGDQKLFMLQALQPQSAWGQTASWKVYVHLVGQERAGQGVQINELFLDRFIWSGGAQWDGQWQGFNQNQGVYRYQSNKWECTEIALTHNTPGQANGRLRVWINDSLVLDHQNVKLRDNPVSWNALQLNAWYGNPGVPKNQKSWIDQIIVSRERIGCSHTQSAPTGLQANP